MKTTVKKVMITGGHVTPAIAVIDEILSRKHLWNIVFIGRTKAFEGGGNFAHEKELIEKKGIRFIPITTGRIQRSLTVHTIRSILKIPAGFIQALVLVHKEKPDIVLSFGGYVAFPVVVAAAVYRIPVVTHEQTRRPGLANRIIARFANKICISFEDTKEYFPQNKTVYTGLPVRKELFAAFRKDALPVSYKTHPIIYVTGGSTGSTSINALVFSLISRLTERYTVIHQAGFQSLEEAARCKKTLPADRQNRYMYAANFDAETTAWILQKAVLVVGRAGANTVIELAMLQKNAILIPLPWAGASEQNENAKWLQRLGLGSIIDQSIATSDALYQRILQVLQQGTHAQMAVMPRDGAEQVVNQLQRILG